MYEAYFIQQNANYLCDYVTYDEMTATAGITFILYSSHVAYKTEFHNIKKKCSSI